MEKSLVFCVILVAFAFFISPHLQSETIPNSPISTHVRENFGCVAARFTHYREISEKFIDSRFTPIGEFYDLTVKSVTLFAPNDDGLYQNMGNFSTFESIIRRHVVPCKLTWTDLELLEDGAELPTFLNGFNLKISKSGDILMVNGVPVVPDGFSEERFAIHEIGRVIELNSEKGLKQDSCGFQKCNAGTVLDYVFSDLLYVLLIHVILCTVYIANRSYGNVLMIPKYPEIALMGILVFTEAATVLIEEIECIFLRLPLMVITLYIAWALEYHYPAKASILKCLDMSMLVLTTEGVIISTAMGDTFPVFLHAPSSWMSKLSFLLHGGLLLCQLCHSNKEKHGQLPLHTATVGDVTLD